MADGFSSTQAGKTGFLEEEEGACTEPASYTRALGSDTPGNPPTSSLLDVQPATAGFASLCPSPLVHEIGIIIDSNPEGCCEDPDCL